MRLCGATAVTAVGRRALAIGKTSRFRMGQLSLGEAWNPRPGALGRLAWELEKRTSITVDPKPAVVDLARAQLRHTPYLYLAGDREFLPPAETEINRLRRFLTFGGFLHIDSAEGVVGGAFDRSVRRLIAELFPSSRNSLALVPKSHVVYKSFYLIPRPVGRVAISSVMEGIIHDKRLVVAYTQNDLGGAWSRDDFGNFHFQCEPGGERQREMAFRLGTNLAMYALCLDYKTDQVHVPFIMRRRRWRPDDGAEDLSK
jgi:hypothetical protein